MGQVLCWVCVRRKLRGGPGSSGHCCAERGGHANWGAGFLPLPAPPPPCRATHILGSSRMHLWGDVLSGER